MTSQLTQVLSNHLPYLQDEVLQSFTNKINQQLNSAAIGIVFYGSCMRTREYQDAMLDFYVIVGKYTQAYNSLWYRVANSILPPNVFYIEVTVNGERYRAKYAVMSKRALENQVSDSFHSYFWARFTQPIAYIYSNSAEFSSWLADIQAAAAKSFYNCVRPIKQHYLTSAEFWQEGLSYTYAAEIRAEAKHRATLIYESNDKFYDDIYNTLKLSEGIKLESQIVNRIKWKVRIIYGKCLSVLRLMKATTTFVGGVDYIAWKIERHTGEAIDVSEKMRRRPWIYVWPVVIKLYRQGKFR